MVNRYMKGAGRVACASFVLVGSLFIAGCGSKDAPDTSEGKKPIVVDPVAQDSLGSQYEGDDLLVSNETGFDIKSIAVKHNGATDYAEGVLFDGLELSDGTQTELDLWNRLEGLSDEDTVDLLLTTSDDGLIEMRNVPVSKGKAISLLLSGGVGYVAYVDAETNEVVNNEEESIEAEKNDSRDIMTYDMENQRG